MSEEGESALGSICLLVDSVQHGTSHKLASVEPGSVDGFYMLAAFCFDAARKMEYMFKATRQFAEQADPRLAREIRADNDAVKKAGGGEKNYWKPTAEALEKIMLRLYNEIGNEHDRLLRDAAKSS